VAIISLSDIVLDEDIYPRSSIPKKDHATVERYIDDLKNGSKFPPLEVQKIIDNGEVKTVFLDGVHRATAYKHYNGSEPVDVEVNYWKEEALDKEECLLELILRSAELNSKHGKRLEQGDAKSKFTWLAGEDDKLKIVWKDVAKSFGVTPDWASECVKDIIAKKRASRDSKIVKMSLEGWTQEEIGEAFGITGQRAGQIESESDLSDLLSKLRQQGKTPEELSKELRLDPALTWALLLRDKTDDERLKEFLGKGAEAFNVWTIGKRDQRLGNEHPMNIPGQIAMNLLYYFTEQGDLVVDPMAGGGSTIDACLVMNRKIRAYDIDPKREDIIQRDICNGLDDSIRKAKLIFFDLPYGDMVADKLSHDEFYNLVRTCAEKSYEKLENGGLVAYIMCDYTKGNFEPFIPESYNIFKKTGFECIHRISVPLTTQSANGDEVNKAREKKKLLGRDRVLFVFRRPI